MKFPYRPEIDGLKAIAIFTIFLSHFPASYIQSGGVNIFFVLSGFLIAQIIEQKYKNNAFGFYASRIKSLYPQLLIISISIYILFLFFGDPEYIKRVFDSCKYAILGVLNMFFIRQEIAYGEDSFLNPYGPLWAFSVIIQFYITYYLIYKFFLKKDFFNFSTFSKVFLLTILSYLFYSVVLITYPDSNLVNFYSLLTRYWQFLAGAALFFYLHKNTISERIKNILILLAFMIMVAWQLNESLNINFQIKTVLISLIALFVIAGSGAKTIANYFLSSKVLIHLGKLSYPFYLWHMAIIYFAYTYILEVNALDMLLITFTVLFLSYLSLKLNNYLIKAKYVGKNVDVLTLIVVLTILSFNIDTMQFYKIDTSSFIGKKNYITKINYLFAEKHPKASKLTYEDLKAVTGLPCFRENINLDCNFSQHQKNKVILLGSSHMAIFSKKITDELLVKKFNVHSILPVSYFFGIQKIRNYLLNSKKATIVISQKFPKYLTGKDKKTNYSGIYDFLNELIKYGHKLVLVYPIPEFAINVPSYYKKELIKLNIKNFKDLKRIKGFYKKRTKESFRLLDSLKSPNIERIYPDDYLCDDKYCYSKIDNKILYSDDDHLNENGVELIVPEIINKIDKLLLKSN